jgi:hypothetical protein
MIHPGVLTRCVGLMVAAAASVAVHNSFAQSAGPASSAWQVNIDKEKPLFDAIRVRYHQAGAPVLVDGLGFDISRRGGPRLSLDQKRELSAKWERVLVDELEDSGFESLSDERLEKEMGLTREGMRQMMIEAQPFGERDLAEERVGKEIFFLVDESPRPCARGTGAMGAFVAAYYPLDQVQSDYGSVTFMIFGIGRCDERNPSAQRYVSKVKEDIVNSFPSDMDQ